MKDCCNKGKSTGTTNSASLLAVGADMVGAVTVEEIVMNRCPITYQLCTARYSEQGLKLLSRTLTTLHDLPLTTEQLRREAAARAAKMSIQGVQPKVAARLNVAAGRFEIVDVGGRYILKPQTAAYPEVPENEDLTMRMAAQAGIETPFHGLIYGIDGALTYFIRRFDRKGRKERIHVEDFAQLSGKSRDTKYRSSMEQVVKGSMNSAPFRRLKG